MVRLRHALADSQEHLKLLMDSRQSAEEELKSANEELMSSMEELQSANEELQTSHEELESTNEELTTVNDQLGIRNRDLTEISNDLTNLVTSVDVPIVILSGSLRLRRSTVAADKVMGLTRADVGRHLSEIRHTLRFPDLESEAAEVLKTLVSKTIEVQNRLNCLVLDAAGPYGPRTTGRRLVVVLFEIDRPKRSFQEVERQEFQQDDRGSRSGAVARPGRRPALSANRAFLETFHIAGAIEDRPVFTLNRGFGPRHSGGCSRRSDGRRLPNESEIGFKIDSLNSMIATVDARQLELDENNEESFCSP